MKKIFKRIAVLMAMVILISALPALNVKATPSDVLEKLKKAEEEKEKTEEQKKEAEEAKEKKEDHLDDLTEEQGNLKVKLNNLNDELSVASDNLTDVEKKIEKKEAEIEQTLAEIEEAKRIEEEQYDAMMKRFKISYESPRETFLEILLGSTSYSSFLNNTDYLRMVADYDVKMYDKYTKAREDVVAKEEVMEEEMAELQKLKAQIAEEHNRISNAITTTYTYVADYEAKINTANAEIAAYEAEIEAKEQLIKDQEEDIEALRAQYQRELALSKAAQAASWRSINDVYFEDGDRNLLANLIYCEAGSEAYEGKLAVGAVVINRLLSSRYPGTISGVIYQPSQFSPAGSGRLALALAEGWANSDCFAAADQAMKGASNVGNCLYFRTPLEGMEGTIIGGHIFY